MSLLLVKVVALSEGKLNMNHLFQLKTISNMKKYLFVFRETDENYEKQSSEEMQAHFQRWGEWMEKVQAEGHELNEHSGKVVSNNGKTVKDEPFGRGKELVGGYVIVPAKDFDHAVQLSMDCPIFEFNYTTEIREVIEGE